MGGIKYLDREIKEKAGTLRKGRSNPVLLRAKPVKTLPTPEWLGPIAQERWKWAVKTLSARGTLTADDAPMLELFCILYERIRIAIRDEQELKPSLISQLRSLGESFGLTPTGRTRVHVSPAPKDTPDEWDSFVKGGV